MSSITATDAIKTNSVEAIIETTGSIGIGVSQTDGILNLGTGASRTATGVINIGNSTGVAPIYIQTGSLKNTDADPAIRIGTSATTKYIKIGSTTDNNITLGNLDIATRSSQVEMNMLANKATNNMFLCQAQTSGAINIGSGGGTVRTGNINVGSHADNNFTFNLMNGARSRGTINMFATPGTGNGANATAGTVNIATATTATANGVTTAVNIATGSTTGVVSIGNTNNILALKSETIRIQNDASTGGTVNIKNNTTSSGDVNIKGGLTSSGVVNIATGTGATQTTSVNIGSGTTTGAVTIGNSTNETIIDSGTVSIQNDGNVGGNVNIKSGSDATGSVNIGNGGGLGTPTVSANICSGITTGTVTIGNTNNTTSINSNNVTISSTSGFTNLYGGTNCGRSTSTTPNTYIEMFTGSPNAVIDFHSAGLVNNDFDARIVSFGGSSSTDPAVWNGKGLLELTASPIQMNGTLLMKDSYNITLAGSTNYVAPTAGQLGYLKAGTMLSGLTTINSGNTNIGSLALDPGSWIINAYCGVNAFSMTTDSLGFRYSISLTSGGGPSTTYLLMGSEGTAYTSTNTAPTLAGTAMVSITSATTYYLNVNVTFSAGTSTLGTVTHWNAMRIG